MNICLLDKTNFSYNFYDLNNSKLRAAETILINIAISLSKLNHQVSIINNCPKNEKIGNINWININSLKDRYVCDLAISNNDCNHFDKILAKKKILISHSIQTIEKFIRKKQLLPYLRHKPKLALLGKYHLSKRNYFTRMFGFFFMSYGVDQIFTKTKLLDFNLIDKKQAIFTSRPDRNLELLIDLWTKQISPIFNQAKLLITPNTFDHKLNTNIYIRELGSRENMINDLLKSRMIILPGHKAELFCLAAEEARELCVPIVTLGIGSLSERVNHNKTGLVAKNKNEFVDFVIELFKNDKLWLSLRSNLIKLRNSRTWDCCAKELLKNI